MITVKEKIRYWEEVRHSAVLTVDRAFEEIEEAKITIEEAEQAIKSLKRKAGKL